MRSRTFAVILVATGLVATSFAVGGDEPKEPNGKLYGEVIAVKQQTRQNNQGEFTEIQVRTRNQQEHWLRLGASEQFGDAVEVGDRVRVRYRATGNPGEPAQVQTMLNYRNGARIHAQEGQGTMVQNRFQYRDGTGTGSENCEQHQWKHQGTAGNGSGQNGGGQNGGDGQGGGGQTGGGGGRGGR